MTPAIADCWYRAPLAPRLSRNYYIVFFFNCQIIFHEIMAQSSTLCYNFVIIKQSVHTAKTNIKEAFMQPDEIITKIAGLCSKYSVNKCILFGSRAKGTALERSDIDVAVSGASDFYALDEEVQNLPTLFTIDLINLDTCRNTLLLEDINKYGKKIYEKI